MTDAAIAKAVAEAKVNLPDRPEECQLKLKEDHAPLVVGSEVRTTLKMERKVSERQYQRFNRCETFYDSVWNAYQ